MKNSYYTLIILCIVIIFSSTILLKAEESHWAKAGLIKLSNKHEVDFIFKDKNLDRPITRKDFEDLVSEVFDIKYAANSDRTTREVIVYELVKIWFTKTRRQPADSSDNMYLYLDSEKINSKYKTEISTAYINGIAKGRASGYFVPKKEVTYGELAVLLNNTERAIKEDKIIKPMRAKEIIKNTADRLIHAISIRDANIISKYVHPDKGVRFTPYTYISLENDLVFSKERLLYFFKDKKQYLWGRYDGSGEKIRLTPKKYYKEFIYSKDFKNAPEVGYNEVLSSGNMYENQFEIYDNPIIVEYYFPGFDPKYDGMDWKSLRLVFENYEGEWKLVGIIHNQWTI